MANLLPNNGKQTKKRKHAIQSNLGFKYKSNTFGELIYKARTKEDIKPEQIETVLI